MAILQEQKQNRQILGGISINSEVCC